MAWTFDDRNVDSSATGDSAVVLGVASVLAGFFVNPTTGLGSIVPAHWLSEFLARGPVDSHGEDFSFGIAGVSTLLSLVGIALAYVMYIARRAEAERLTERMRPAHVLLSRKYYIDELYETHFTGRLLSGVKQ